jgi:peptidyl-prolyl cis-trans isomerase SurA
MRDKNNTSSTARTFASAKSTMFNLTMAAMIAGALSCAASSPAFAQKVVVVVNGSPITAYDIEQREKLTRLSGPKAVTRKEVVEDLIDDKLKLAEAKRYALEITDADVQRAIEGMASRTRMNYQQFVEGIGRGGVNIQTLKDRVRAELAWGQLVRGRYPSSFQVEESEVREALASKNTDGETTGYDYRLRPVIFIVPKGSPPSAFEARVKEAEALRSRFQGCDEGVSATRGMRDVAVRDIINKTSGDFTPEVRAILDSISVGQLTKPEVTQQGVEMYALCGKTQTKIDTPLKKDTREAILNKRADNRSKRYLQQIRKNSMVEYK